MKRLTLIFLTIAILALVAYPVLAASTAKVIKMSGEVRVNGEAAVIGALLSGEVQVETGKASGCEIEIDGRAVFRLYENSETTLYISDNKSQMDVQKGAFAMFAKKLRGLSAFMNRLRTRRLYEVRTPTAIIGVRGTTFYVQVEKPDCTYFCCCNGRVETAGVEGGPQQIVAAAHHKGLRFTKAQNEIQVEEAPMLYHGDEEMEALAGQLDEQINWEEID